MKAEQIIGKIKLGAKRNAPELLLGTALLTGTTCVVLTSRPTMQYKVRLENAERIKLV